MRRTWYTRTGRKLIMLSGTEPWDGAPFDVVFATPFGGLQLHRRKPHWVWFNDARGLAIAIRYGRFQWSFGLVIRPFSRSR